MIFKLLLLKKDFQVSIGSPWRTYSYILYLHHLTYNCRHSSISLNNGSFFLYKPIGRTHFWKLTCKGRVPKNLYTHMVKFTLNSYVILRYNIFILCHCNISYMKLLSNRSESGLTYTGDTKYLLLIMYMLYSEWC